MYAIEGNGAAASLQGNFAKRFFRHLDPLHTPPQTVPFMRIVRLLDQAVSREYKRLINNNVIWLGSSFASTNSDFYVNPERRETYGAVVSNMVCDRYLFKEGRAMFVSRRTLNEGASTQLAVANPHLADLEFILNFEYFSGEKTGKAIGAWLVRSHADKGLLPEYVLHHR
jgi:hypothetical protein